MFHPRCIVSTVAQTIIHLVSMAVVVDYGRQLEGIKSSTKRSLLTLPEGSMPQKMKKLLSSLAEREIGDHDDEEEETRSLFRRPPFRPNYETNVVFIFSVLQSALSALANHKGKPFYRSILESRQLSFVAAFSTLACVACISESFPAINGLLELRPLPSRKSKLVITGIAVLNVLLCAFCRVLDSGSFRGESIKTAIKKDKKTAADLEETLLEEESRQNLRGVVLVGLLTAFLALEMLAR